MSWNFRSSDFRYYSIRNPVDPWYQYRCVCCKDIPIGLCAPSASHNTTSNAILKNVILFSKMKLYSYMHTLWGAAFALQADLRHHSFYWFDFSFKHHLFCEFEWWIDSQDFVRFWKKYLAFDDLHWDSKNVLIWKTLFWMIFRHWWLIFAHIIHDTLGRCIDASKASFVL